MEFEKQKCDASARLCCSIYESACDRKACVCKCKQAGACACDERVLAGEDPKLERVVPTLLEHVYILGRFEGL